ncbi:MAG: hypothetical protein H5T85_02650 [Actinobacteria bacterium]|nr:hypothetical protein [Actinomycetota bacterium]
MRVKVKVDSKRNKSNRKGAVENKKLFGNSLKALFVPKMNFVSEFTLPKSKLHLPFKLVLFARPTSRLVILIS